MCLMHCGVTQSYVKKVESIGLKDKTIVHSASTSIILYNLRYLHIIENSLLNLSKLLLYVITMRISFVSLSSTTSKPLIVHPLLSSQLYSTCRFMKCSFMYSARLQNIFYVHDLTMLQLQFNICHPHLHSCTPFRQISYFQVFWRKIQLSAQTVNASMILKILKYKEYAQ